MSYLALKHLHMACAVLSIAGFFIRGVLMLADSSWLRARFTRIAPHVVDTVLLASAIALAVQLGSAAMQPWLGAKIVGLLVYIGLGMVALRRGRTKAVRTVFWIVAMLVFGYVFSVAISKNPLGFLAGL